MVGVRERKMLVKGLCVIDDVGDCCGYFSLDARNCMEREMEGGEDRPFWRGLCRIERK